MNSQELDHRRQMEALSRAEAGGEGLTPRQRLAALFDRGEFQELFRFARASQKSQDFRDGLVCATGEVHQRPVLAYASEFSFQGGSVGRPQANQILEVYRLARQSGLPLVSLNESAGARVSDGMHIMEGFAGIMKEAVICSGVIPQIACTLGHCIGASAFVATLTDFVIMEAASTLCIAGASVNQAATGESATEEQIGGPEIHSRFSGNAHFVEPSEAAAIQRTRQLLAYLPANNAEPPPLWPCEDPAEREEPAIEKLIPDNPDAPFDMLKLIQLFVDRHSFLEVQGNFAPNVITGFARFGGQSVGVVANQSLHLAGAFDCNAFRKLARFINFLGAFNFPLVSFVDVPGAIPTVQQHKEGILTHGSQLLQAIGHFKPLKISIVVRRCFGGAYCMMHPKISGGDVIFAYPGAMIGIMSDKAMRSFLKQKELPPGRLDDPFIAAGYGYIDDIIEPAQTRPAIIHALKTFGNKRFLDIPPKWLNNPPL